MGMTLFYVQYYSGFLLGLWWWILAPMMVIVMTLTSLVLTSIGLDEIANPRVRTRIKHGRFIHPHRSKPVLEVNNLKTYFYVKAGTVKAVDGVYLPRNAGYKSGSRRRIRLW